MGRGVKMDEDGKTFAGVACTVNGVLTGFIVTTTGS